MSTAKTPTRTVVYLRSDMVVIKGVLINMSREIINQTREGIVRSMNSPNSVISVETSRGWTMIPIGSIDYVTILENEDAIHA